ncbi:unnamed protein product [Owenia fusiformis]|uniref:Uncharacterized protein n=1 Tax=Owenia fusiformis TaxID=6347 RepID=A0A8J1U886_OWEFU|nr:unnamed protein product [Owenia fusiformis]
MISKMQCVINVLLMATSIICVDSSTSEPVSGTTFSHGSTTISSYTTTVSTTSATFSTDTNTTQSDSSNKTALLQTGVTQDANITENEKVTQEKESSTDQSVLSKIVNGSAEETTKAFPFGNNGQINPREFDFSDLFKKGPGPNRTLPNWTNGTSDPEINVVQLTLVAIVYGLTFLMGAIGNIFVLIAVLAFIKTADITNVFLLSLSCADLLLILVCLPFRAVEYFMDGWHAPGWTCYMVTYLVRVSFSCSILTLTMMAVERYYAICHALKSRYKSTTKKAWLTCGIVWLASFVLALPTFFAHSTEGQYCIWSFPAPDPVLRRRLYFLYWLCVLYIIPFIIMAFAYLSISVFLWRSISKAGGLKGGQTPQNGTAPKTTDDSQGRIKVIKMLISVMVIFMICWGPILILDVVDTFYALALVLRPVGTSRELKLWLRLLAYFNSCINPILYCFLSRKFRQSFLKICVCGRKSRSQKYLNTPNTTTTSTSASMKANTNTAISNGATTTKF